MGNNQKFGQLSFTVRPIKVFNICDKSNQSTAKINQDKSNLYTIMRDNPLEKQLFHSSTQIALLGEKQKFSIHRNVTNK